MSSPVHQTSSKCMCSPTQTPIKSSNLVVEEFLQNSFSGPLSFLSAWRWGRRFQPSYPLVFLMTSPILSLSKRPTLSHLININSGITPAKGLVLNSKRHFCHSENSQGCRSSVPGIWDRDQIQFFIVLHISKVICLWVSSSVIHQVCEEGRETKKLVSHCSVSGCFLTIGDREMA